MSFYLDLPTGYSDTQTRRRYPVLYLLAGLAGNYKEWPGYDLCDVMDDFIAQGVVQPMIVVMPSGNDNPGDGVHLSIEGYKEISTLMVPLACKALFS